MFGETGHEFVDFFFGDRTACWVSGRVKDHQPCSRGNLAEDTVGVEREIAIFEQRDRDRLSAGKFNDRFVDGETWIWIEYFCPGFAKHKNRKKHGDLAAGHH